MEYLPLDIHIEIARYLSLRDALAYSEVSTTTFDAVYYVFAHRELLDFSSLLDANNIISMPDTAILAILHAHTRASVITNFCLPRTFSSFVDLDQYMSLYWMKWTRSDDNIVVGHSMGMLEQIEYLNCNGLPYSASAEAKTSIRSIWEKYEPDSEVLNYIDSACLSGIRRPWFDVPLYYNWSTANIEVPYHCSTCNSLIPWKADECEGCSPYYIH
jgi:hypothetical protein